MLPIVSVDLSAITSIETDPVTGTVYTATASVTDQQIPPDKVGHRIRAYTDLYGWVFRPKFDKHGRTIQVAVSFVCNMDFKCALPQRVLQTWMDTSLQSITNMHQYLSQYGCPPYIRRVAGKVVQEGFDALTNNYQIIFIAKHQPSNSYRARKQQQQQNSSLWCTDIRFHRTMFPHGLDIKIMPENIARVQVSPKEQKSIKIFTTDEAIDGKQVTFTLTPLHHNEATHYTTYRYNGELFTQQQPQAIDNSSKSEDGETTASSEPPTPNATTTKFIKQIIVDGESSLLSTSTAGANNTIAEAVVKALGKEDDKQKQDVAPSITVAKVEIEKILKKDVNEEKKKKTTTEELEVLPIPLNVPKGYLLVPEHQVNVVYVVIYFGS
jgi:hypothetical protein